MSLYNYSKVKKVNIEIKIMNKRYNLIKLFKKKV